MSKPHLIGLLFLVLSSPLMVFAQNPGPSGDVVFWLPLSPTETPRTAQVERNREYVSVKLHSVFAYYKSGFLENIKQLIVASEIAAHDQGRVIQGTMLNKVWQKLDSSGDFIALNDHLAVLAPATPTALRIKVAFRGLGHDRFKPVFDALGSPELKTALTLSDAAVGKLGGVTAILRKFLSTPYTSENPRQMLDVEESFVLYPAGADIKPDALRQGYLVVVSTRSNKTEDLGILNSLGREDVRLSSLTGQGLEYKDPGSGSWKPFTKFSYVVFSVTKNPIRGEDEGSAWFKKYSQALDTVERGLAYAPLDKMNDVKAEAFGLWREGNALLTADGNYVDEERKGIKARKLDSIKGLLARSFERLFNRAPSADFLAFSGPDVPNKFSEIAASVVSKKQMDINPHGMYGRNRCSASPSRQKRLSG